MLGSVSPSLNAQSKNQLRYHPLTAEEAFDPAHTSDPPSPAWIKKVVFDASYEEVFRAATTAATQTQWEIEKQDKHAGFVFAKRLAKDTIPIAGRMETAEVSHLFRVTVTELGAKETEVAVAAKTQWFCIPGKHQVFGLSKDKIKEDNERCQEFREGMWESAKGLPEASQFMVFLRNNLIVAGVQ
jgi:hypothetical protein